MNRKTVIISSLILFFSLFLRAQPEEANPAMSPDDIKKNYEWRIQQVKLAGQYIPKDLFDAFKELNKLTDSTSRETFRQHTEGEAVRKLYFSLGRWITTNWGLYEGSRLGHYFREAGLPHPEDQAVALIVTWHRSLNKKDINFKQVKEALVAKRKREREARLNKMPVIKEEVVKPAKPIKN